MDKFMYNGIVEDRQDPLKLGRVRVRLVGVHNFNRLEVPTEALPWAESVFGTNVNSIPKEGDWVLVYCQDGNPDYPVVLGVIPGIKLAETNPQVGFGDPRTSEQKQNAPTWPEGTIAQKIDEPTTFRISRADISDTPTKVANDDKEHVCNIQFEMKIDMLTARLKISSLVQWLRSQIESLFSATSESAFVQSIQAQIKQLLAKIKEVYKAITEITSFISEVAEWVQQIRDLITWILSLPTRLLAFLQECLTQFFSSIGGAISNTFGDIVGTTGAAIAITEIVDLLNTSSTRLNAAKTQIENQNTQYNNYNVVTDLVADPSQTYEKV